MCTHLLAPEDESSLQNMASSGNFFPLPTKRLPNFNITIIIRQGFASTFTKEVPMPSLFPFSRGPRDWQALLADPVKYWETGYSREPWRTAGKRPPCVAEAADLKRSRLQ
jgi:hypothetical protein